MIYKDHPESSKGYQTIKSFDEFKFGLLISLMARLLHIKNQKRQQKNEQMMKLLEGTHQKPFDKWGIFQQDNKKVTVKPLKEIDVNLHQLVQSKLLSITQNTREDNHIYEIQ